MADHIGILMDFLDFGIPWGPYFGAIFRLLESLGPLLEALGPVLEALRPVLEPLWANVVMFDLSLLYFGVPQEARDFKKQ